MVPVTTNMPASLPISAATSASNPCSQGPLQYWSKPTSPSALAFAPSSVSHAGGSSWP